MTGYRGQPPKFKGLDAAGVPLAGGKVYTYESGTDTPLATYTDSAGATENANPVVLDANGEATIFWTNRPYKVELADADDATIWTIDPYKLPIDPPFSIAVTPASSTVLFDEGGNQIDPPLTLAVAITRASGFTSPITIRCNPFQSTFDGFSAVLNSVGMEAGVVLEVADAPDSMSFVISGTTQGFPADISDWVLTGESDSGEVATSNTFSISHTG